MVFAGQHYHPWIASRTPSGSIQALLNCVKTFVADNAVKHPHGMTVSREEHV